MVAVPDQPVLLGSLIIVYSILLKNLQNLKLDTKYGVQAILSVHFVLSFVL